MKKDHNPKTHSAKKGNTLGNTWHFNFKAHIGIDEETRLVHNVKITSANEHNIKNNIYKKLSRNGQYAANEKNKSSVSYKIEHIFAVVKRLFGYRKTRYRGLQKQAAKNHIDPTIKS